MASYLRCRACGLIIEESDLGDTCHACGVKSVAFEPYRMTVSDRRRSFLELHLHPILVHFPQAFAVAIAGFAVLSRLVPAPYETALLTTVQVLTIFLAPSVLGAMAAGIIDGRVRFKKLGTTFLVRKIIVGVLLFGISTFMGAIVVMSGVTAETRWYLASLALLSLLCDVYLARIGIRLMYCVMPG